MPENKNSTNMDLIFYRLDKFDNDILGINNRINNDCVSNKEFLLVKNIVYGSCALVLTAVLGALITLVVTKVGQ